ncbi:hypothetical protein MPER_09650, partial [Moniliophthora perniciosa FA553]
TRYGLRQQTISWDKLLPLSRSVTVREGQLFFLSQMPDLTFHFPRVTSWDFAIGDDVESLGDLRGEVIEIKENGLYIDVWGKHGRETRHIGWHARKIWKVGELVRHSVHGWNGDVLLFDGETGETSVHVTIEQDNQKHDVEMISHSNLLVRHDSHQHLYVAQSFSGINAAAGPSRSPETQKIGLARTGQTPWVHVDILSMAGTNKCTARIVNVLIDQKNKSGLAIVARSTVVGASTALFTSDYDDVLTLEKKLPLHVAFPPSSKAYNPRFGYQHPRWKPIDESRIKHMTANPYLAVRSATPPLDSFDDFDNVFDDVRPLKTSMDNSNAEGAETDTPNANDFLAMRQKLLGDATPQPMNIDDDDDDNEIE